MGTLRAPRPGELSEFGEQTPLNILNEQGISGKERFTIKNLAANPSAAKAYLQSIGYEVRDLPPDKRKFLKWNFAVRKGPADPWKVTDPDGFEVDDIFDLIGDAAVSVAAGLGAAGGPLGVGAAAAGGELLRQGAGAAAGIPGNLSAMGVGAAGAGGVGGVLAQKGLSAVGRKAAEFGGEFLGNIGARIAKAKPIKGIDMESIDVLIARGLDPVKAKHRLPSVSDVSKKILESFDKIYRTMTPEKIQAQGLEKAATQAGVKIDFRKTASVFRSFSQSEEAETLGTLGKSLERVDELIGNIWRSAGVTDPAAMPLDVAVGIKQTLQAIARKKGSFNVGDTTFDMNELFKSRLKEAAAVLRADIVDQMGGPTGQYAKMMKAVETRMKALTAFETNFKLTGSRKATDEDDIKRVAEVIKTLGGSNTREAHWEFLLDWEKQFGIEGQLSGPMRRALIGEAIGTQGAVPLVPAFTAEGGLLGLSLIGGGAYAAGPGGAALGTLLVSPRNIVRMAGGASTMAGAASRLAASPMGQAMTEAQRQAVLQAFRQMTTQVDPSGKAIVRETRSRRPTQIR